MEARRISLSVPPITALPNHSFPLSLICTNEASSHWFMSNYVQTYCRKNMDGGDWFDFYAFDLKLFNNPWLITQRIERETAFVWNHDITQLLIDYIDLGNCIYTYVDEYFVPETTPYQKWHFSHSVFIYGYDKKTRLFDIATFLKNGIYRKFGFTKISFDLFEKAFMNTRITQDFMRFIHLLKFNYKGQYKFDLKFVVNQLHEYVSCINTSEKFSIFCNPSDAVFGLETYDLLCNYIDLIQRKKAELIIQPFHILWEHKKCMNLRIEYLQENGYISKTSSINSLYGEVEKKAKSIRNLLLKYSLTDNTTILEKASVELNKLAINEESILRELLAILEVSVIDKQLKTFD